MSDSPIAAVFTHEGGTVAAAWFGSLFGVEGHETVPGTHRPPYIHPTRTSVGRRDWLDVLAPKPADR